MKTPRLAAAYVRISDDAEGLGLGVIRQQQDCLALAASLGWQVPPDRIYVDNDLSAYAPPGKLPKRPEYDRLVDDISAGEVNAILCWHTDRLHRTPLELEHYIIAADKHDVELRTVRAGTVDLSTPNGRAIARTMCAWARQESEHKSERIGRKHQELADDGKDHGGGTRPYGYEADRVTICVPEAVEIRGMFNNLLAGWSIHAIVGDLNRRKVPTVKGSVWKGGTVKRLMLGGRVAGLREHRRAEHGLGANIVAVATWPAIVDRATWEAARSILVPTGGVVHRTPRTYLLSGLVRCGRKGCGKKLVTRPNSAGKRGMVCASGDPHNGCGRLRVDAEGIEEMVEKFALRRLSDPRFLTSIAAIPEDVAPILDDIVRDEHRLTALAAAFGDSVDDDPIEYRLAAGRIRARVEANRGRVARSQSRTVAVSIDPLTVRTNWPTFDISQRRALVDLAVESVTVVSAITRGLNRFDPRRVTIVGR
jgi:site-specific DNA recombinase